MPHTLSHDDRQFRREFESGQLSPGEFDHRAHVHLAYVYLVGADRETAIGAVRGALQAFLRHHGADPSRYHETLTRAWVLAVAHFMERSAPCASAAAFIEANPALLDPSIMLTHYSAESLFSDEARAQFVAPDLDVIPHAG